MSIIGLCVVFSGCSFQNSLPDNQDLAETEALVARNSDAVHNLDEELIALLDEAATRKKTRLLAVAAINFNKKL